MREWLTGMGFFLGAIIIINLIGNFLLETIMLLVLIFWIYFIGIGAFHLGEALLK